jgi:hypothetical protein
VLVGNFYFAILQSINCTVVCVGEVGVPEATAEVPEVAATTAAEEAVALPTVDIAPLPADVPAPTAEEGLAEELSGEKKERKGGFTGRLKTFLRRKKSDTETDAAALETAGDGARQIFCFTVVRRF